MAAFAYDYETPEDFYICRIQNYNGFRPILFHSDLQHLLIWDTIKT